MTSGWKSFRMVVYGFLAGTAGIAVFSSRDAKKADTHFTAAVKPGGAVSVTRKSTRRWSTLWRTGSRVRLMERK